MNDDDQKPYDPKHRAFSLLVLGATQYMHAAYLDMLATKPEAAAEFTAQFRERKAHVGVYIQFNQDQARAEIALVTPEFTDRFDGPLLRLNGPIEAATTPPESMSVTDLSKLN